MKHTANMKYSLMECLGYNSNKTVLCISATRYGDDVVDPLVKLEYKLKRGYTPEQFGRFLEDLNYTVGDYNDIISIIVWYTDDTWSWSGNDEEHNYIRWEHFEKPNPDNFNL